MHCVSLYPTPNEHVALGFMEKMIRRYPYVRVGYSGHEAPENTEVAVAAIAKGARLLERHVGVPTDTVQLNAYSMDPDQMEALVRSFFETDAWGAVEAPSPGTEIHFVKATRSGILTDEARERILEAGLRTGQVHYHEMEGGHWLNADNPVGLHELLMSYL